jgi:hypothetical protein
MDGHQDQSSTNNKKMIHMLDLGYAYTDNENAAALHEYALYLKETALREWRGDEQ